MSARLLVSTFAAVLVSGSAMATDYGASTAPYNAPMFFGYVDIRAGYLDGRGSGDYFDPPWEMWDERWDGPVIGGSARLAARMSPSFSVQGDVWINSFDLSGSGFDTGFGPYSFSMENRYSGIAGHLTWRGGGGQSAGALVSYGSAADYGEFMNVALEGVYAMDQWRFYGQIGHVFGVGGPASTVNARSWYAGGVVTYYYTPNLAVSANLGVTSGEIDWNSEEQSGWNWGARIDFKPENMPFTTYVAYQGRHWDGSDADPSNWSGTEHAVVFGVRLPLNATSIKQMHGEVGLFDMNPVYGDLFAN